MIPLLYRSEAKARVAALSQRMSSTPAHIERTVRRVLAAVAKGGDRALVRLTRQFDGVSLPPARIRLGRTEVEGAYAHASVTFLRALDRARTNIEAFHRLQIERSWILPDAHGGFVGLLVRALPSVGVYVPGGTGGSTPLMSTALMGVIPAQIAGVPRIAVASPPRPDGTLDPHLVIALDRLGVEEVYKVGGAQAIAALAYGTRTVVPVDKIVGPGGVYVAIAKQLVARMVEVDRVAGPSEVVVLADDTANPRLAAADMLAQAEHDARALAILVTTSRRVAGEVARELERQIAGLGGGRRSGSTGVSRPGTGRASTARAALEASGAALVYDDLEAAIGAVNAIAPEHLEVLTVDPQSLVGRITGAGAIFLGPWSAQAAGDYVAGPNHTLPTGGTARRQSPLGVWDFIKRTSVVSYTKEGLQDVASAIQTLAALEGLPAHGASIGARLGAR